jgi:hypothetical protein
MHQSPSSSMSFDKIADRCILPSLLTYQRVQVQVFYRAAALQKVSRCIDVGASMRIKVEPRLQQQQQRFYEPYSECSHNMGGHHRRSKIS